MPLVHDSLGLPSVPPQVLIVGAGAVGLTMAVALARRGVRVFVLEAGGRTVSPASQALFEAARWRGHPLEGLHRGRFRALGGTTNFWGGQLTPFEPIVFGPRPWAGAAQWPMAFGELEPFYDKVLATLGLQAEAEDTAVWTALGIAPPSTGADLDLFFTRWLPEPNFSRLFRGEIERLATLTVCLDHPVTALELGADGRTVTAALVRTRDGVATAVRAPVVVLANGTVEIARLLMLPLADGASPPWADNPWLGRGFMDHVDCDAGDVRILDDARFRALFDNVLLGGVKYSPKLKLSQSFQAERRRLGVAAHFMFNSRLSETLADAKIFVRGLLRGRFSGGLLEHPQNLLSAARVAGPMMLRYLRHRRISSPADLGVKLRLTAEQAPSAENRLVLLAEKDALGLPIAEVVWNIEDAQIDSLMDAALAVRAFLADNGLGELTVDPLLLAANPAFLRKADDANHQMGMVRMGTSPSAGVVDQDLKVFGAANLFVAGAAVFPSSGFANPTFTAMALGARLSEHLAGGIGQAESSPTAR